jgi:hypothetical protein
MTEKNLPANAGPNAGRGAGGRFRRGASGNPRGKPRGTRHRTTLAVEALLDGEAKKLTRKAVQLALKGDPTAMRLCFDRICPPRRGCVVRFELPDVTDPAGLMAASAALLKSVAAGELSLEAGEAVSTMLASHLKVVEATDIATRIAELERRTGVRK